MGTIVRPALERFEAKVERVTESGCWIWMAGLNNMGYGRFHFAAQQDGYAHRWAYAHWKGPIPEGLTLDHLCRVPCCVNPDHLEAVSMQTNILRGTGTSATNARKSLCQRGHELLPPSVKKNGLKYRRCFYCERHRRGFRGLRKKPTWHGFK